MGMKRQPNMRSYWYRKESIFYCSTISNLMTRTRFFSIMKCFYITNPNNYVRDKGLSEYDKLGQVQWLKNSIRDNCKRVWNLGKYCSVEKMMVRYKGTYCPLRQYMPEKPQKCGIKVWCLANWFTKFVWNFEVYCGRALNADSLSSTLRGEPQLAHKVVLDLVQDIGHLSFPESASQRGKSWGIWCQTVWDLQAERNRAWRNFISPFFVSMKCLTINALGPYPMQAKAPP